MKRKWSAVLWCAVGLGPLPGIPARADGAADEADLNPVVITATRTAQTVDETLASVTVITRDDIERLQAQSIMDLLTGLPGVSMTANGGAGTTTSLFLRGTDADHVLVMIDGIKVGSATLGQAAFQQIPVDQIERIELVRGPRSSLYGSEAIGGVIQIFTRRGKPGEAATPSFSIGGGSYDTYQGEAGLSGSLGRGWYNGSVNGFYTNGIQSCQDNPPASASCFTTDPRRGYQTASSAFSAGYRWSDGTQVTAEWLRNYGDSKFDGSFEDQAKVVQQVMGATLALNPLPFWTTSLAIGQSEDQEVDYLEDTYLDFIRTQRNSASWQNDLGLGEKHRVSFGVDYQDDHVTSDEGFPVTSRENIGGFGLYQGDFGGNDVQGSLRSDHNQQFGNHVTGAAAWGRSFSPLLRVTASYGTAFKAPSFDDLYYPFYGNPDLRPESSRSAELGLSGRPQGWNWSLNAYQTNVNGLIEYDPATGGPDQLNRARIRGVEGRLAAHWRHWKGQFYATWLDPRIRTAGVDHNNLLPRRAQQSARLDLDRDCRRLSFGGSVYVAGRRYDDQDNTIDMGGYTTVDLRAGFQVERRWLLQGQIRNLLDKEYQTAAFYRQQGRTFFITLRYHPVNL